MNDIHPLFPVENTFVWQSLSPGFWMLFGLTLVFLIGGYYIMRWVQRRRQADIRQRELERQERELRIALLRELRGLDPNASDFFLTLQRIFREILGGHFDQDLTSHTIQEIVETYEVSDHLSGLAYRVRDAHYLGGSGHDPKQIHIQIIDHITSLID